MTSQNGFGDPKKTVRQCTSESCWRSRRESLQIHWKLGTPEVSIGTCSDMDSEESLLWTPKFWRIQVVNSESWWFSLRFLWSQQTKMMEPASPGERAADAVRGRGVFEKVLAGDVPIPLMFHTSLLSFYHPQPMWKLHTKFSEWVDPRDCQTAKLSPLAIDTEIMWDDRIQSKSNHFFCLFNRHIL